MKYVGMAYLALVACAAVPEACKLACHAAKYCWLKAIRRQDAKALYKERREMEISGTNFLVSLAWVAYHVALALLLGLDGVCEALRKLKCKVV